MQSAYELLSEDFIKEYGARTALYRHRKSGAEVLSVQIDDDNKNSGAEVLSVQIDDDNKVFGVTFRTPPEDSTGVPHILEHSVLCGSRKFPVKEPFVDLLKGSLQTFLNAFTYPDRTCYPVASQNTKDFYNLINVYLDADFYNLINVYLDAVLFPRAVSDPMVMQQEGWHYELENASEPLSYKGVVFNEMKGVYSSPDSLHGRACQQALFPDNTYGVDSGGDPSAIPDLTFDYFKNFHRRFYHPANSRIYFYGDDPVPKRLELLDEYLSEFDRADADPAASTIQWQKMRQEPWSYTETFPASEEASKQHMLSVNWLLNDTPMSPKEKLALNILDDLLVGNSAATLQKALTDSGLGSSVIGGGLSDELLQATFSIGLKGVAPEKVSDVETLILDTLKKCAEEGFEDTAIAASLNSAEFELREFNTGSFPRGLSLMLGAVANWVYDRSPTSELHFEAPLAELKADIANGEPVFQNLVKKLLVENGHRQGVPVFQNLVKKLHENGHRVTVEMKPDTKYEAETEESERSRLEKVKASMTQQDIDEVIAATEKLKAAQAAEDAPEAKATIPALSIGDLDRNIKKIPIAVDEDAPEAKASIPALSIGDLDRNIKKIPIAVDEVSGVKVVTHAIPSSGILYADVGVDITGVPLSEYPLLGLFSRMLLETGAGSMDRVELTRHIGTQTGGVYCTSLTGTKMGGGGVIASSDDVVGYLFLRGKAVSAKTPELLDIVRTVVTEARLDSQQRAIEILKETKARLDASIVGSGHSYASMRIESRYTLEGYLNEISGGISSVETVKSVLKMAEDDWPALLARLEKIRASIVTRNNLLINLTGDQEVLDAAAPAISNFINSIPGAGEGVVSHSNWAAEANLIPARNEGFAVQTQVNYVGKGGRLFQPGEVVPGSFQVVSRYLRTGYLWDNVRVMGGAYGGFCNFNPMTGLFSFLSYRDPNLAKTLDIYDGCADYLTSLHLPADELQMSVIGAVGDMDSPQSADQKGFMSLKRHLIGMSDEDRQRIRDEVLATSTDDFKAFGDRLKALNSSARSAVVGSKAALEAANQGREGDDAFHVHDI
ncbi:Metalloenzyme, LuxS/M16 peptidase-like protein [Tribonema minus]|uniref:Metalloenzyme, LuxS/M16 peptidase-like protein n=1 Tax=Tribonema minus TaxID=303371 RepID=A0A835YY54_9STRA|nr:Metalloenzyme, LuxS/M16 peptidase-like protein [Tribonema minus]